MGLELRDALRVAGPARGASVEWLGVCTVLAIVGCVLMFIVVYNARNSVKWTGIMLLSIWLGTIYTIGVKGLRYPLDEARWFLFSLMSVVGAIYALVSVAKKAIRQNRRKILLWFAVTFSVQVGTCIPFVWNKLVEVAMEPVSVILYQAYILIPVWCVLLVVMGVFTLVVASRPE